MLPALVLAALLLLHCGPLALAFTSSAQVDWLVFLRHCHDVLSLYTGLEMDDTRTEIQSQCSSQCVIFLRTDKTECTSGATLKKNVI